MRVLLTVAVLLCASPCLSADPVNGADRLHWFDASGEIRWSAPVGAGDGASDGVRAEQPILARTWFRPLEDLLFRRLDDGDPLTTADLLGDVVVLDFWASWCAPCRYELPRMQAFHDSRREKGLTTLAINLQEQPELALSSAGDFGLGLPIVEYGPGFAEAFAVRKIPTIILVDRLGRVRARWELFTEEVEKRIYDTIDAMLEPSDAVKEPIAARVGGDRALEVRWMREFSTPVHSAQSVAGASGQAFVIASVGRDLQVMHADARTDHMIATAYSAGRLAPTEVNDDGGFQVLAYRPGGTTLSRFESPAATRTDWESPAPLLDAAWVDPGDPGAGALVAMTKGLAYVDSEGQFGELRDVGLVRGIAPAPEDDDEAAWVALTGGADRRHWRRFSANLDELGAREVSGAPWRLEGAGDNGYGVFSPAVKTATVGRYFGGVEGEQVAVATADHLVVLETGGGEELFRARWPGIGSLAAADTDGDGLDELVVSWGSRLAVLAEAGSK